MEKFRHKKISNVLRQRGESKLPDHKTAVELDELDWAIIEYFQDDPFFSYAEMAEKWNVTSATIRNRVKRLKSNNVIDLVLVINPYKVGYDTFAMIGIRIKANSSAENLIRSLQEIEGVSGINMVSGSFDFFIVYICRNLEEYRQFISEKLRKMPEIESFESFIGLDLYERKYQVGLVG